MLTTSRLPCFPETSAWVPILPFLPPSHAPDHPCLLLQALRLEGELSALQQSHRAMLQGRSEIEGGMMDGARGAAG